MLFRSIEDAIIVFIVCDNGRVRIGHRSHGLYGSSLIGPGRRFTGNWYHAGNRCACKNLTIGQGAGVLTVDTRTRKLYLSLGGGQAMQYGIGVGRQGFEWKGAATIGRKAVWPGWTPPPEMLERRPDLPQHMEGGLDNPLGARALYLFKGNKDTLFRIHGTNEPETIGRAVSSGCIRMHNADVIDLYQRVPKGAKVVVL